MLATKDNVDPEGLNIWIDPGEVANVDIFLVQGFGAHPYGTWSKTDATIFWPKDLLPEYFPRARIGTYAYKSGLRSEKSSTVALRSCGEQLLIRLRQKRLDESEKRRPLVLVGHSLGGLVIQQALVVAAIRKDYDDIRKSLGGLIFLGTPMQGSEYTYLLKSHPKMRGHDQSLLGTLMFRSDELDSLRGDLLANYSDITSVCFYESNMSTYGRIFQGQTVDRQSASLGGPLSIPLATDHSGLNKFTSNRDPNFEPFVVELKHMVNESMIRLDREKRLHLDFGKKELLKRLDYHDRHAREAQILNTQVDQETFEWIWESPFAEWLSTDQRFIWIRGKPGSGKSTLMAQIKEDEDVNEVLEAVWEGQHYTMLYFFFDFRQKENTPNTLQGLLSSLLYQMIEASLTSATAIRNIPSRFSDVEKYSEWPIPELQRIIRTVIFDSNQPLVILIDGLDEYNGDKEGLCRFIKDLNSDRGLKICVASRPDPIFVQEFKDVDRLDIQDWIEYSTVKREVNRLIKRETTVLCRCDADKISFTFSEERGQVGLDVTRLSWSCCCQITALLRSAHQWNW